MDVLSARVLDETRFVKADRKAVGALLRKAAPDRRARGPEGSRRASNRLAPATVGGYVDALYAVASKCLKGAAAAAGLVAAISDGRVELRRCMRRTFDRRATYINKLNAVVALFNHVPGAVRGGLPVQKFWRDELTHATAADEEDRKNNVRSERLESKWFRLEDLDRAIAEARSHVEAGCDPDHPRLWKTTLSMRLLWLVIARHTPPHRRDYGDMRVVRAMGGVEDGENAVVVTRGRVTMVLQDYKTRKTYGRFEHEMPDEVAAEIRRSLAREPRRHLFTARRGGPMTPGFFGDTFVKDTFARYIGKEATVNTLRKVWVEHIKGGNYTHTERERFARIMNHSLMTQIMSYETVRRDE